MAPFMNQAKFLQWDLIVALTAFFPSKYRTIHIIAANALAAFLPSTFLATAFQNFFSDLNRAVGKMAAFLWELESS